MRIRIHRTGGFAGIERRAELDTAGRPDATDWHELADRAFAAGRQAPPAGVPDGFAYRITVDDRTVHCADPELTGAQRELITRLLGEGA
ncbi:protealysin inhibitor emfourin [Streptomyces meridianus]|uniref:Metalloprotease n=1 Tax=Streptomyces meridianus TaxID=2938945 RepID=A0ABT0X8S6_9ACTN|nr:protealysin inhibitor emfourin [Streptomyces meridianus]MCM2578936.1 hypothetical protein [Streptomyces meridianus]